MIIENLSNSFPEKSINEINRLKNDFYNQFFQVWSETLKSRCFDQSNWNGHVKIEGMEVLNQHLSNNESVILLSGHTANWEWSGSAISQSLMGQMTVFFKPVKKESFGQEIHAIREKHGINAVAKDNALRYLIKTRETPQLVGIIGDQIPAIGTEKYWLHFLHQKTAFYQGAEKFALSMKYPVYYSQMKRVEKGLYVIEIIPVFNGTSKVRKGEIIKRYAELLETTIRNNPADYLWSHRRWKYTLKEAQSASGKDQLFIS